MMDVQVKGDKYKLKYSFDESKKEVYRNECADIGCFADMPTFEIACTMPGASITKEIGNGAHCYAKTDACASQSAEDAVFKAVDEFFEAFGADCEFPSGNNASAEMASGASTTFRGAVASAILVGVVFAALPR